MRLGGSLALPISAGFEFFHTFRGSCEKGRGNPHQVAPWTRGNQRGWLTPSLPSGERAVRRSADRVWGPPKIIVRFGQTLRRDAFLAALKEVHTWDEHHKAGLSGPDAGTSGEG